MSLSSLQRETCHRWVVFFDNEDYSIDLKIETAHAIMSHMKRFPNGYEEALLMVRSFLAQNEICKFNWKQEGF
jgi:hypothetical protein